MHLHKTYNENLLRSTNLDHEEDNQVMKKAKIISIKALIKNGNKRRRSYRK